MLNQLYFVAGFLVYSWEIGYTEIAERCQTMNPRLKSSTRWTHFPKEYQQEIAGVFKENFKTNLKDSALSVEGRIYNKELILAVAFGEIKSISRNNFIVSMDFDVKNPEVLEKIHLAVDAIASLVADFFEKDQDNSDLPRHWQEVDFEKTRIYFMYSTENADLEREANQLLGENFGSLVEGSDADAVDALDVAEMDPTLNKTKH